MKAKLHYVLSIAILLFIFSATAQNTIWEKIEHIENSENLSKLNLNSDNVHLFKLNASLLGQEISSTPLRTAQKKSSIKTIDIPGLNGEFESFRLYEAPVFSPELAAKYPNIKSYVGVSAKDSKTRLRMSVSPQGVQTMISYIDKPTVFMQPVKKGADKYVLYEKHSKNKSTDRFECQTIDVLNETFNKSSKSKINEGGANTQTLQKFRIAISTTAEYTNYHDDGIIGNGNAVADALSAINATLTRVNQVFETDMAVTFELISNNNLVIYTDAATDPYSDANEGADSDNSNNLNGWSLQVQNTLTSVLGNAAYDIGHLFGASGGGGNAGCIGCVCRNDTSSTTDKNKGSAFTSPSNGIPEGDTFDIDYVAHEIGHQMGANHTWAFTTEGTGVNSEPGSGTTIMGYAGITGADNVALNSDDYFHYHSIKQILDNLATKSCQTTEAILNNPPIADAGSDYNIPKGTAYILKGAATDADGGDNLTYCWEQIDNGVTDYQNFGPTLVSSSMNRSLPPSGFSDRYIPKLSSVVSGNTTQTDPTLGSDWETVSTVARTLNWALTVRDRSPVSAVGGQTSFDRMQINVEDVTPFTVNNPVAWTQGTSETIEWVVGQTTNATINCQRVNILLSSDGGLKFKTTIATNVPNTGSYTFTVPAIANTDKARILVEAADNIFYDVSDFDFLVSNEADFIMVNETLSPIACGDNTATFTFDFVAANGFSENTVFSASGNPGASTVSFSPSSRNSSGPVTMTISNLDVPQNDYSITITGTPSVASPKNKNISLPFYNGNCTSVANTDFDTSTTFVEFNTINNASAKPSGYSDYTSISTNVNRNSSYNLTVNVNTAGAYTTLTRVWIDWNRDCEFDDITEAYDLGTANNDPNGPTSNSALSITIPNDAVLGNTIMRISTKWDGEGNPMACENSFDGEVEDYTLNVQASLAVEEFGFENFMVYPNPNKGEFTIKLNSSLSRNVKVEVYDLRGRTIYKSTYKEAGDFNEKVNLIHVQSGMYILTVSDGLRKSTKKIIVE
ncbi:reprolysin-like metallopeptidase [Hwangdonia lutea]|uniref:Zinc-dependent metalloprotease family protein n=1 Tax=Hwangdonia lutea TaxID=3075823 RepID=A0AA97ERV3_9FLAO|nr:zinc-dependent metalloprotease family protein [Hwangdonia sp. SCSIO 19198]WOD45100.1 zinc-dependent metalloprotease family protein [Hwangdonia sp. SCSIO 19198]